MSLLVSFYTFHEPAYAVLLSFLSGCIQLAMGFLHLGFLLDFISCPVIRGFTSAATITIGFGQMKNLLGLRSIPRQFFPQVYQTLLHIGETRAGDAILGLACMVLLFVLKLMREHMPPPHPEMPLGVKFSRGLVWTVTTARNALVVSFAALIAYSFEVTGHHPFVLTGKIAEGLPPVRAPPFSVTTDNMTVSFPEVVQDIGAGLAVIPLVGLLESIAVAKSFASQNNYRIDANQELLALGLTNMLGSFVSSYPVTGSFGRTAVNAQSGVCTPAGGLVTGVLVLLSLNYLTSLFYYIPKSALAAVIIMAVAPLFDAKILRTLWRVKRLDLLPLCVTFLLCFWEIQYGILAGTLVSLLILLHSVARPETQVSEGHILVLQPASGLHFPAIDALREAIMTRALEASLPRCAVLECTHVSSMDYTVVVGLSELLEDFQKRGVTLAFVGLQVPVLRTLLAADLKGFQYFTTLEEAAQTRLTTGRLTRDPEEQTWTGDNIMECPQCRHVSGEKSPRFCSQCGQKLPPAAPVQADSENNNTFVVASTSEEKAEPGNVLRKEGFPGSSKDLDNPEESESDASWTVQMEVDPEVFVDASEDKAGGPEGAQCPPSKRKKKETGLDAEQSKKEKRKRKRSQNTTLSSQADSLSSTSGLWSLDVPSNPGSPDSALPQKQAHQGSVGNRPDQSLDTVTMSVEEDGSVHAEGSSFPPQGHTVIGVDSDIGDGAQRDPVPSNHTEVKDLSTSKPSVDKGLPPEGDCGPALSAHKDLPQVTDASQRAPLPESKGVKSEHKEEVPVTAELAASEPTDATAKKDGKETNSAQKQKPSPVGPAASKHQYQEAELKGKLSDSGRKTGEAGNTQPDNQKKPEENRNYAAALKDKKEQRNQKAAAPETPLGTLNPENGVTVYFHAIVSRDFAFRPDHHRVCVRGGEELGKRGWINDACEMHYTKDLGDLGSLIEGSMIIPRQSLDKPIPYKYVIHRGGSSKDSPEYEFIYEHPQKKGEHVNRCLLVVSTKLGSGDWHQYDDIICMKPSGTFQKFKNTWFTDSTRKDLVKGKKHAATIMLDRIFSILQPWSAVNLQSFMTQFRQFYSVVREPKIHDGHARPWSSLQYDEKEVRTNLWEHVKKQMASFQEGKGGDSPPMDCPVRSRLKLGLAVLFMVEAVDFVVPKADLVSLCNLLIPSTDSPEAFHGDLSPILSTLQKWRAYLVTLCHKCITEGVDCWMGTLPVLHYCMQLSPPKKDSKSQPEDTWAGLEGISFAQFRDKASTKSQVLQFMQSRMALLQVDEYLFRSWFSLVHLESLTSYLENSTEYLSLVPARVLDCFQGISYRLRGLGKISNQNIEDIKHVFKMLIHLVDIYQDTILGETLLQTYLTECLTLHETVCNITTDRKFYEIPALSAELVCKMLKLKRPVGTTEDAKANEDWVTKIMQEVLSATRKWLRSMLKSSMFCTSLSSVRFTYPEEMALWRRLVEMDFPGKYGWKTSLLGDMEGRLKQEQPRSQISVFCNSQWQDGLHDSVARSFEKCVIEAVSSACQSQTSVLQGLSCPDLQKFGTLLSAVITKSWPVHDGKAVFDVDEIFRYLLTQPDVKHLFQLCGTNKKILEYITGEGKQLMATAESVFQKVAEELENGTIVVGQLELILEHRSQFVDIWNLNRIRLPLQEKACDLKDLLDRKKDDLRFLKREKRFVESLLRQFGGVRHLVQVEFGNIEAIHSQDLSNKKLSEAVIKLPGSSSPKRKTHYSLSPEIREIASKLDSLKDSHIFQVFWKEMAESLSTLNQDHRELKLSLQDACEYLYYPCYDRFHGLYENVKSGELTFAEVDDVFGDFVDKYDELTDDLKFMCTVDPQDQKGWISERVGQIKEYHSLHQAVSSAKVIFQVRSTLGVTGDFSVLHTLLNFADSFESFRHEKLKQISPQFIQAKKLLRDISEPRHHCLEELSRQVELVSWLHEALEDINELKVFVDLASISAGENDIDVDRVACFHDAVQGYASLLYKMDSGADFYEFMDHLQELWRALDNDQHLPSKLLDSARNLEWLKTVKESHGSVELSSLTLATAINNRGIYVIEAPKGGQKISPDTVLQLLLPDDHGTREGLRTYSTEELKELLNKLMLMSGKKDHNSNVEVEKFSEVFSSMQRLVQAFINLHCAGNMLFRTWTAQVYCRPRQGVSIRMDFGLELVNQLKESGDIIALLGALCKRMEDFLDHWKRVVTQKRAKHFYLNFYTAEQLVYLSSELRKPRPSKAALMMLSFIKNNCTIHDIVEATGSCESSAARRHLREAVKKLPQQLLSESSLMGKLQVIMDQSIVCMSAFLPNCLDLDTLGRCLAQLATLGDSPVERPLPKGLQAGQPNLVLCGHSEVLLAALAIYMQAPRQPLPTFDEVLLCTPGTTVEEVELLLRRCLTLGSQEHKVYSLLFADQLSYEVGCRAEEVFRDLCTQRHREDYQLVIVCDAAREHCCLPSAFSQHKVPLVPQAQLPDIQAYLKNHYRVPEQTLSAATVFRDRMCVGIVTSERAGVGNESTWGWRGPLYETLPNDTSSSNRGDSDEARLQGSGSSLAVNQYPLLPSFENWAIPKSGPPGFLQFDFLWKLLTLRLCLTSYVYAGCG
ncbi:hypothetical protein STEG23_019389 [Scotinomys teguina]